MMDEGTRPRYVIGVAAKLIGVLPHTLRSFERRGLLTPFRTNGNMRLYSDADLELVRRILQLRGRGVNLAGIKVILEMEGREEKEGDRDEKP